VLHGWKMGRCDQGWWVFQRRVASKLCAFILMGWQRCLYFLDAPESWQSNDWCWKSGQPMKLRIYGFSRHVSEVARQSAVVVSELKQEMLTFKERPQKPNFTPVGIGQLHFTWSRRCYFYLTQSQQR
jgi:hypothetical protein